MNSHHVKAEYVREKLRQLAADVNDLNRHENTGARPTSQTELQAYSLAELMAWSRDVARRRIAAGLPENVKV